MFLRDTGGQKDRQTDRQVVDRHSDTQSSMSLNASPTVIHTGISALGCDGGSIRVANNH